MKTLFRLSFALVLGTGICGGVWSQTLPAILAQTEPAPGYRVLTVHSTAVARNLVDDPADLTLHVVLPTSYTDQPQRRYPVVYFLHGYGDRISDVGTWKAAIRRAQPADRELIFVGVDGHSALTGAFWTNSPVTGGWEDWLTAEAVPLIDHEFRTQARAASRGLAGFSMGGSGALSIGLRHPDQFGAVFAASPGLLDPAGGLRQAWDSWQSFGDFLPAYAAAWAPDPTAEYPHGQVPNWDGSAGDTAILQRWENGFGNLTGRLAAFQALKTPLRALKIFVGTRDGFRWIPAGCAAFDRLATQAGLAHELETFVGGHGLSQTQVASKLVPFFCQNLAGQP